MEAIQQNSTRGRVVSNQTAVVDVPNSKDIMASSPKIEFDGAAFDPMKVMAVRHNLIDHPLLQLPALVELAQRLGKKGSVRYHDDRATTSTRFADAPQTNPITARPEDIVRSIESAHA